MILHIFNFTVEPFIFGIGNKKIDKLSDEQITRLLDIREWSTENLLKIIAGKNTGSISKKTDYILAGERMGPAKLDRAKKLGVEIIDEHTINIKTKAPFGPLLAHLAHPALGIVNKKQVTENEAEFKTNPVGTGSYKFKEWVHGNKMVLEKNEDFYDKNEKGFKK